MNKLKRYYNQNRKKIWGIIIIVAFLFVILQLANYFAKKESEKTIENAKIQQEAKQNSQTNSISNENTVVDGNNNNQNEKIVAIKQFVQDCNKGELENAYNMLTQDCKNEMYGDLETFKNLYYLNTFEGIEKEATIEKWSNNTYLVKLAKNALETGKIATTKEEQKVDYITAIKGDNDNYYLNINNYIGYKELSKTKEKDGVKIEVLAKNTYKDFERYTIRVTNNTESTIILDSLESSNGIYIEDANGVQYPSYNSELASSMVNIGSSYIKQMDIKFFSSYSSTKTIKQLVFSNYKRNRNLEKFVIEL